jgi:hypothetical protein
MKTITLLVLTSLSLAGLAQAAEAVDCSGASSHFGINVECADLANSAGGNPGQSRPGGDVLPPGWSMDTKMFPAPIGTTNACNMPDGSPGIVWQQTTRDANAGIVSQRFFCVPLDPTAAPAVIPDPPSLAEIVAAVPWPKPTTATDPITEGVTGLESRFWYTAPRTVGVATTLNGWTVTGTAQAVRFTWRTGDGHTLRADTGGSPTAPAARHLYETKGNYTLELSVTWSGNFTVSGPGPAQTRDLASIDVNGSQPYRVVEVRSVLDG